MSIINDYMKMEGRYIKEILAVVKQNLKQAQIGDYYRKDRIVSHINKGTVFTVDTPTMQMLTDKYKCEKTEIKWDNHKLTVWKKHKMITSKNQIKELLNTDEVDGYKISTVDKCYPKDTKFYFKWGDKWIEVKLKENLPQIKQYSARQANITLTQVERENLLLFHFLHGDAYPDSTPVFRHPKTVNIVPQSDVVAEMIGE